MQLPRRLVTHSQGGGLVLGRVKLPQGRTASVQGRVSCLPPQLVRWPGSHREGEGSTVLAEGSSRGASGGRQGFKVLPHLGIQTAQVFCPRLGTWTARVPV